MSESKFTPGPWEWSDQYLASTNEKTWSLIGSDGYGIMSCDGEANSPQCLGGIGEANAHLIAAAPDLYKALAHLEPYLDAIVCYASTIEEHPPNGFILETKAALAKARGEG